MSKILLTDVDEVLFDWSTPFEEWVRQTYPEYRDVERPLRDHWDVEDWLGCELAESREMIRIFNGTSEIWSNFKPLPGVVDNVHLLHEQGFHFAAITACARDVDTWEGRWKNINDVFGYGVFDTLHCVGLAEPKAGYLARYRPTYWVEDKMKHAVDGANAGHKSFLVNYKHNQKYHDERITRVDHWGDIVHHIRLDNPVL